MREFVFIAFAVLTFAGFGDVRGQSPKDGKPKDIKEIAVDYVLGEPDRLMTQRAEARNLLSAMENGEVYSAKEKAKLGLVEVNGRGRIATNRTADGILHFYDESAKASSITTQKDKVAALEKTLLELKAGTIPMPRFPLDPHYGFYPKSWEVGTLGLLKCPTWIRQIIDANSMLNECNSLFLVKLPTKGLVDGKSFYLNGFFVVSGTKQYTTASGGTNTVFVLEQIDLEWLKAEAKKRMAPSTITKITDTINKEETERVKAEADKKAVIEKEKTDRIAAVEKAKWHTWTDSTGQYKTEAMFGGVAGGKVKLIKKNGSTVRLPLEQLSEEDQQWIKDKAKKRGPLNGR